MRTHVHTYILYVRTYVRVRWSYVSILAVLWPDLLSNDYNAVKR